jgi:hypothetical protein
METVFKTLSADNSFFLLEGNDTVLTSLKYNADPYSMNWIEGEKPWGTVLAPNGISVLVQREVTHSGTLRETYLLNNTNAYPLFTCLGDIGVYAPFNDSYHESEFCMKNRCHTHIWCGGTSSYVMCLRMGGEGPHLGFALTKGSLGAYSIERILEKISNDRGDFILHLAPLEFGPGETHILEWELFWHQGKDDFYRRLQRYPSYVEIEADHFVTFRGEKSGLKIVPREGQQDLILTPGKVKGLIPGEQIFSVKGENTDAWCRTLELPPLMELAEARCSFIAEKQQYSEPGSVLDGAYLIYDNEEGHVFYTHKADHNASRERVGMGVLIARFLRLRPELQNSPMNDSLKKYLEFVMREIFDPETGMVYDDIMHSTDRIRLYNFPWFAQFFLELHGLWKDDVYLRYAYLSLQQFYIHGGDHFYAINLPILQSLTYLEKAAMTEEYTQLKFYFIRHADTILQNDLNYPPHEVKYEQSIVAPAADILLQSYLAFGDEKYLEGGKKQIEILSLFSGRQPDSCLYETAIRHWDGLWFGKYRLYGDTFPHYWSALSGIANAWYYKAGGGDVVLKTAEASIRGVLGLFRPNGSASCARLYPLKVNGEKASLLDPWANDQDWGLYYALRFFVDADEDR